MTGRLDTLSVDPARPLTRFADSRPHSKAENDMVSRRGGVKICSGSLLDVATAGKRRLRTSQVMNAGIVGAPTSYLKRIFKRCRTIKDTVAMAL